MRPIDADKLKIHYAWWGDENEEKQIFDTIVDLQPTLDSNVVVDFLLDEIQAEELEDLFDKNKRSHEDLVRFIKKQQVIINQLRYLQEGSI